jgi:UDP-GlcNAc:undecaprenyl-phosphate GlcNAc-1-phosphate transferase
MITLSTSLGVGLLSALGLTLLAIRFGRVAMDDPGTLAIHATPTPRTGGLAICGALLAALAAAMWVGRSGLSTRLWGFLAGGSIFALTGLWDDARSLRPWERVLLECLGGALLVLSGTRMHLTGLWPVDSGLTVLYLVGAANAMNLLDGMDGLASGVAGIAAAFLAAVALACGQRWCAVCSLALLGACLGFLPYNFHRARIFMGDAGSLFLGFTLAALSISVTAGAGGFQAALIPVLLLGLPWFDTTLTVARRLLDHRSLFTGDRGHFYDQLVDRGLSQKQAVLVCYGLSAVFGGTALLLRFVPFVVAGPVIALQVIALAGLVWRQNLLQM